MPRPKRNVDRDWKLFYEVMDLYDEFDEWIDKYWDDEEYWKKIPFKVEKPRLSQWSPKEVSTIAKKPREFSEEY